MRVEVWSTQILVGQEMLVVKGLLLIRSWRPKNTLIRSTSGHPLTVHATTDITANSNVRVLHGKTTLTDVGLVPVDRCLFDG